MHVGGKQEIWLVRLQEPLWRGCQFLRALAMYKALRACILKGMDVICTPQWGFYTLNSVSSRWVYAFIRSTNIWWASTMCWVVCWELWKQQWTKTHKILILTEILFCEVNSKGMCQEGMRHNEYGLKTKDSLLFIIKTQGSYDRVAA